MPAFLFPPSCPATFTSRRPRLCPQNRPALPTTRRAAAARCCAVQPEEPVSADEVRTLLTSNEKAEQQRGLLLVRNLPPGVALELLQLSVNTSKNDFIRATAAVAIGQVELTDPSICATAVSLMCDLLATADDYSLRSAAAAGMGYVVNVPEQVVITLVEALQRALLEDPEWQVIFSCLASIGNLRHARAVPTLLHWLDAENPLHVQAAVGALGDIADVSAVPDMLKLLGNTDMMTRQRLAHALAQMPRSPQEPAIVDALRTLSRDQSFAVRDAAMEALKDLGVKEPERGQDKGDDELIDLEVANLLEGDESGNAGESAADALRRRLERSFDMEFVDTDWRLPTNDTPPQEVELPPPGNTPPTTPFSDQDDQPKLDEPSAQAHSSAYYRNLLAKVQKQRELEGSMTSQGKTDMVEFHQLVYDLQYGDSSKKTLAAIHLRQFDPLLAIHAIDAAHAVDPLTAPQRLRSASVNLLARARAVDRIIAILQSDPEENVRSACCDALMELGGGTQATSACVAALREDGHWLVRISAAIALGTIAKTSVEAESALMDCLRPGGIVGQEPPQESVIRRHVVTALGFMGSTKALRVFRDLLAAGNLETPMRFRVAAALRGIPCAESVELVRILIDDEDDEVSVMAQGSLDSLASQGFE